MLDEIDVASAESLTALNTALANRFARFPDGMIERHKDCYFVATGNTFGRGGNRKHPDRNALDAATLDRFGTIKWEADKDFERALALSFVEGRPDDEKRWARAW